MSDFALDPVWGNMSPVNQPSTPSSSPPSLDHDNNQDMDPQGMESPTSPSPDDGNDSEADTNEDDQSQEDEEGDDGEQEPHVHLEQSSTESDSWTNVSSHASHTSQTSHTPTHPDGQLYQSQIHLISNHYERGYATDASHIQLLAPETIGQAPTQSTGTSPSPSLSPQVTPSPSLPSSSPSPSPISTQDRDGAPSQDTTTTTTNDHEELDSQDILTVSSHTYLSRTLYDSFNYNGSEAPSRTGSRASSKLGHSAIGPSPGQQYHYGDHSGGGGGGGIGSAMHYDQQPSGNTSHRSMQSTAPMDPRLSNLLELPSMDYTERPRGKGSLSRQYSDGNLQRFGAGGGGAAHDGQGVPPQLGVHPHQHPHTAVSSYQQHVHHHHPPHGHVAGANNSNAVQGAGGPGAAFHPSIHYDDHGGDPTTPYHLNDGQYGIHPHHQPPNADYSHIQSAYPHHPHHQQQQMAYQQQQYAHYYEQQQQNLQHGHQFYLQQQQQQQQQPAPSGYPHPHDYSPSFPPPHQQQQQHLLYPHYPHYPSSHQGYIPHPHDAGGGRSGSGGSGGGGGGVIYSDDEDTPSPYMFSHEPPRDVGMAPPHTHAPPGDHAGDNDDGHVEYLPAPGGEGGAPRQTGSYYHPPLPLRAAVSTRSTRSTRSGSVSSFYEDDRSIHPTTYDYENEDGGEGLGVPSQPPTTATSATTPTTTTVSTRSSGASGGSTPPLSSSSQQNLDTPTLLSRIYTVAEPYIVPALFAVSTVATAIFYLRFSQRHREGGGGGGGGGPMDN